MSDEIHASLDDAYLKVRSEMINHRCINPAATVGKHIRKLMTLQAVVAFEVVQEMANFCIEVHISASLQI